MLKVHICNILGTAKGIELKLPGDVRVYIKKKKTQHTIYMQVVKKGISAISQEKLRVLD